MNHSTQPHKITRRHVFPCIDGHTCGNPVRLVTDGHPHLLGATMSERRQDFITRFDWVRTALMFEPKGHNLMSGAFLYPPTRGDCDTGIIFIEVSGCLPVCGHSTIGAVTFGLEEGLIHPKTEGVVMLDTPAGLVEARYTRDGKKVTGVRIYNVPSYLAEVGVEIDCPGLGKLMVDIAYGGNFYGIIDPQKNYAGLEALGAGDIQRFSPIIRDLLNAVVQVVHPEDATIKGVSHIQWTGKPKNKRASGRNAVFYGDAAIDRSPCGTGTSARMAQLTAKGHLKAGDDYIHESLIGSIFEGRVEGETNVGDYKAIRPSVSGWARVTGQNTIFVDPDDPFWRGFQVL